MRPVHRFRVYPNPGTPWRFEVLIFESQASMYKYAASKWGYTATDYHAICLSTSTSESKGRKLGEVLFTLRGVTHGLIGHELIHASHHFLQTRCGKDAVVINSCGGSHTTEEIVAHAASSMINQCTAEFAKRGVQIV